MPGLDRAIISEINWERAINSIQVDARTDFILAPHLDVVYREKGVELAQHLVAKLSSGTYEPGLPLTLSVPKQGVLTRPGSILLPMDRLLYQALIEDMLDEMEKQFDRDRSFSHIPSGEADQLFKSSFEGWSQFSGKIGKICQDSEFVMQCDVANYFETLPQHNLINALEGCGCRPESVRLLEKMLSKFRQNSSQGIVQGIFPSDVLGNFYLTDFDANCKIQGLESARYVDDFVIGFQDELSAKKFLVKMVEGLRKVGLALNPSKTKILPSADLLFEQEEVDRLFDEARSEIDQVKYIGEGGGYGFQGDWINLDKVQDALNQGFGEDLIAVRALIDYNSDDQNLLEKIDRFCLPYLRAVGDEYGIERAFSGLLQRPHLTRHYFSYLNHFSPSNAEVRRRIEALIHANGFYLDYQRMYYMAGILTCEEVQSITVEHVVRWFEDRRIGIHTRAIAAIFICKFGTARERRLVRSSYEDETPYIQAAILYSSQFFIGAEKNTMRAAWKGHSELNALIASVI